MNRCAKCFHCKMRLRTHKRYLKTGLLKDLLKTRLLPRQGLHTNLIGFRCEMGMWTDWSGGKRNNNYKCLHTILYGIGLKQHENCPKFEGE